MKDESAWLIEMPMTAMQPTRYYGITIQGLGLTEEVNDAIRFARKQDAVAVIDDLNIERNYSGAIATEHLWAALSQHEREGK